MAKTLGLTLLLLALCSNASATVVADFFERPDATSATSPLLRSTKYTAQVNSLGISSTTLVGGSSSRGMMYRNDMGTPSTSQFVQFTISFRAGTGGCGNYRESMMRVQVGADTGYGVGYCDSASAVFVRRWINGSSTTLKAAIDSGNTANGDIIRAYTTGTGPVTITVHHYDSTGAEKASSPTIVTDSDAANYITAAGPAGLAANSTSSGSQLDNFYAGDVADGFPAVVFSLSQDSYVSTTGLYNATGSKSNPYALDAVLSQCSGSTHGGKIVWLRGGTYTPDRQIYAPGDMYTIKCGGASGSYLAFKAYPGENVVLDAALSCVGISSGLYVLSINAQYVELNGGHGTLEIMNSVGTCQILDACGSNPGRTPIRSIRQNSNNSRIINTVIHDTGEGLTSQQVAGLKAYGNVVFNNGWNAPDRTHGHGTYYQNNNCSVTKEMKFNFLFRNGGAQNKLFSQSGANVCNFLYEGNVLWNGGLVFATEYSGSQPDDFTWNRNYHYQTQLLFNSDTSIANRTVITNNHIDGGFNINRTTGAVMTGNLFAASLYSGTGGQAYNVSLGGSPNNTMNAAFATLNSNIYYSTNSSGNSFAISSVVKSFTTWQASGTGIDSLSTHYAQNTNYPAIGSSVPGPTGYTYVEAHPETPGVGAVIIYNYDRTSTKNVDISSLFAVGDPIEVIDVQDWGAGPVSSATLASTVVSIDTSNRTNYTAPLGSLDSTPWTYPYACPYGGSTGSDATSVTRAALRYVGGTATSTIAQSYVITAGVNDKLLLSVDGGSDQTITLTAGTRTASQIATDILAQASGVTAITTAVTGGTGVEIATSALGNSHTLQLKTITNSAYATLGLTVNTYTGVSPIVVSGQPGGSMTVNINGVHGLNSAIEYVTIAGAVADTRFNYSCTTTSTPTAFTWVCPAPSGVPNGAYNEAGLFSEEGVRVSHPAPTFAHTDQNFHVYMLRRQRTKSSYDYSTVNPEATSTSARLEIGLTAATLDWPSITVACTVGQTCSATHDAHFPGAMYSRWVYLDASGNTLSASSPVQDSGGGGGAPSTPGASIGGKYTIGGKAGLLQ